MRHRDGIFATIALALSSVALAGMVYTDEYSYAARTEVNGYNALAHEVVSGGLYCADEGDVTTLTATATEAVQK